jgi:hypothetical protein
VDTVVRTEKEGYADAELDPEMTGDGEAAEGLAGADTVREIVSVTLRETEFEMDVVPDGVIDSADREVDAETVAEGGREGELAMEKD